MKHSTKTITTMYIIMINIVMTLPALLLFMDWVPALAMTMFFLLGCKRSPLTGVWMSQAAIMEISMRQLPFEMKYPDGYSMTDIIDGYRSSKSKLGDASQIATLNTILAIAYLCLIPASGYNLNLLTVIVGVLSLTCLFTALMSGLVSKPQDPEMDHLVKIAKSV